jgi:hypothetical protein
MCLGGLVGWCPSGLVCPIIGWIRLRLKVSSTIGKASISVGRWPSVEMVMSCSMEDSLVA